jgi:hypothetical protein
MGYTVESTRSVFNDDQGVYISVGPDADGLGGLVRIYTEGKHSEDYYGKVDFNLPVEMSKLLARAILDTANELEGK